ncbi:MAG: BACON domain-containing protein [Alistipes sp.]|nr:BACON domain-containing protein [Alistipes sp.]
MKILSNIFNVIYSIFAIIAMITCTKDNTPAAISFFPNEINISGDAGIYQVTISSSYEWYAECSEDWITLDKNIGIAGNSSISISVDRNNLAQTRRGSILFTNKEYGISEVFYVTQKFFSPRIDLETNKILFTDSGGTQIVQVDSNIEYDIIENATWVRCAKKTGEISISAEMSKVPETRCTEIKLQNTQYDVSRIIKVEQEPYKLVFTISLHNTNTRVHIEDNNTSYNLFWSKKDKISCNGIISNYAEVNDESSVVAKFRFDEMPTPPYNVIYPAPNEDIVAKREGCYPIVLPSVQNYVTNSIEDGILPLYCYTTEINHPSLIHVSGALHLRLVGKETLSYILIHTESENISGVFDLDCKTGILYAQEGYVSNQIKVDFGKGIHLNTETPTSVFFTMPAGSYKVVYIDIYTIDGKKMVVKFYPNEVKPIRAGQVREFTELVFDPNKSE